jgi:hypothetical protein
MSIKSLTSNDIENGSIKASLDLAGVEVLDCSVDAQNPLIKLPVVQGLKVLNCEWCTELSEVPMIQGLEELECDNCHSLISIPDIQSLKKLKCSWCPSLTRVPIIENLELLICNNCPIFDKNRIYDIFSYRSWMSRIKLYTTLLNPKGLAMKILKDALIKEMIMKYIE